MKEPLARKPHDFEKLRSPTNADSDWRRAGSVDYLSLETSINRTVKYQGAFFRIVGFAGKRFLFSPLPPPSTFFFCSRSNFRAVTRLETLATQAMAVSADNSFPDFRSPLPAPRSPC